MEPRTKDPSAGRPRFGHRSGLARGDGASRARWTGTFFPSDRAPSDMTGNDAGEGPADEADEEELTYADAGV
ncbi:hypothetical protein, partial [Halogeometricum sp. CBA1124]|uniref:hypothetical protein n=1 Tax=Halogeometricum sp. CBA1124 TaxID=2668071 RepID=UPI00142C1F4F